MEGVPGWPEKKKKVTVGTFSTFRHPLVSPASAGSHKYCVKYINKVLKRLRNSGLLAQAGPGMIMIKVSTTKDWPAQQWILYYTHVIPL